MTIRIQDLHATGSIMSKGPNGSLEMVGRDLRINTKRALVGFGHDEGNKLYINFERDFMTGTLLTGNLQIDGEGESLAVKSRWGDHCYIGFYPRSNNMSYRGAWIGYGASGGNHFRIENNAGDGDVQINKVFIGGESKHSNKEFQYTDPWTNTSAAIKANGNIACNDRMRAWNGHLTYATYDNKSRVAKTSDEYLYEQVKGIDVYTFKRDAHLYKADEDYVEGEAYNPNKEGNTDIETINYGVFNKDLPYEVVNYSYENPNDNDVELFSYVSMLTGAIKHLIAKNEALEEEVNALKENTITFTTGGIK